MGDASTLGARALAVRKQAGKTQIEMAKFLGIATATWQKIERDEGIPSGETLLAFERLGVNPGWVLSGRGPRTVDGGEAAEPSQVAVDPKELQHLISKVDEMSEKVDEVREVSRPRGRRVLDFERPPTTIKWYPVNLSAGGGNTPIYGNPGADLNLEELASERLGLPASAMQLFPIRGDSMYPTLADGDLVVIDSRFTFPDDNGIYAFSTDGDTYVKRAEWVDAGRLHWNSDNPDPIYAAIPVVGDELRTMRVFGRVIWTWKPI